MKHAWLRRGSSKSLAVLFNGWGMDENALNADAFAGADLLCFYDYRDLSLEIPYDENCYDKIYLVAWSFGIWVANYHFDKFRNVKMSVAINGSANPVDGEFGIPEEIFKATLDAYGENAKGKFAARIFGGAKELERLKAHVSKRPASEQKEELRILGGYFKALPCPRRNWTRAFAAANDKIFPLENMKNFWGKNLEICEGAHYPEKFFAEDFFRNAVILPDVKKSFAKRLETYDEYAVAQRHAAIRLAEILKGFAETRSFEAVLEIGFGTGMLTKLVDENFSVGKYFLNDLNAEASAFLPEEIAAKSSFIISDASEAALPKNLQLAVSSSALQWIENPRPLFAKISAALKVGGIFAFSTFAPDNLLEIKATTGKTLNYATEDELQTMLEECGFEVLLSECEEVKLRFDSPKDVLRHLKNTGVTGGFSEFWTPRRFAEFSRRYAEKFSEGGKVSLTYRPLYFAAKGKGAQ